MPSEPSPINDQDLEKILNTRVSGTPQPNPKMITDRIVKAYYLTKESGQDKFLLGEQEISIIGKTLDELQSESQAKDRQLMALITAQKIFELIRLRILNDVVTVVKTKHELVTSDNPVKFRGENRNQRPIPMDPTNTLSIPIDKNHLLQLRPWGPRTRSHNAW